VLFALYFLAMVYGTEIVHELATLKASNPGNTDRFSNAMAMSGKTALIASPYTASGGTTYMIFYPLFL
jgi:hypothetical protein